MMNFARIESDDLLVIILAAALAFFLIQAVIFMFYLIKFMRNLEKISVKASEVAHSAAVASKIFEKSARPVAFSRVIANVVDIFKDHKKKK